MRHYDTTRSPLESPPFDREQLAALQEILNRRDQRNEDRVNRIVCGLGKRMKTVMIPTQIRAFLVDLEADNQALFAGTEFGDNISRLLSGRVDALSVSIQAAKDEIARRESYSRI